jgi:hypothetical protein
LLSAWDIRLCADLAAFEDNKTKWIKGDWSQWVTYNSISLNTIIVYCLLQPISVPNFNPSIKYLRKRNGFWWWHLDTK